MKSECGNVVFSIRCTKPRGHEGACSVPEAARRVAS